MRKDTKLFLFYVEKYIILTGKSIFKKRKKRFPVELELIQNPSMRRMLLQDKLRFHQELATHTQIETRNNASQIKNTETGLNNLLQSLL